MMKKLSTWISRMSTGWITLIALLIFLVFAAVEMPTQSAKVDSYAGSSGSPDLSMFYSADDLYQMAETYGVEGRSAYIHARFTFDLAFPFIYMFFLCTGISWCNKRAFKPESPWQLTNLLPLGALLFDLLENSSTALVIGRYPEPTPLLPYLAGFFTAIKWLFVGGSMVMLVAGLAMAGIQRLKIKA